MAPLVPLKRSIATRLLGITFSIYFLIAVLVTLGHMAFEYDQAKKNILVDLKVFQSTFQPILSQMVWSINREGLRKTVEGIAAAPTIAGVTISAAGIEPISVGTIINDQGEVQLASKLDKPQFWGKTELTELGLFGFEFPIIYVAADGKKEVVGRGTFYSSNAIVFQRVQYGFALIAFNSVIKTLALWIIFSWLSERILRRPLAKLTTAVERIDFESLEVAQIDMHLHGHDELQTLQDAFNDMLQKLLVARNELQSLNQSLEQKIYERTGQLEQSLEAQRRVSQELLEKSQALDLSYRQLEQHSIALLNSHHDLEHTLHDLRTTQVQLIESAKLASLGQLVAGVAHELNTPIGNALITSNALEHEINQLNTGIVGNALRKSSLMHFVESAVPMTELIARSCKRAAELITSFKQVATDQTSEKRRRFKLNDLLDDIIATLRPTLNTQAWQLKLNIPDDICCDSYPGPLGQIITNLIQNAMIHAFEGRSSGQLSITASLQGEYVDILFADDGKGMSATVLSHIFEPFYTTRLGRGGSGLGLSISQNIAVSVLGGSLKASSELGQGTCFSLRFPLIAPTSEPHAKLK